MELVIVVVCVVIVIGIGAFIRETETPSEQTGPDKPYPTTSQRPLRETDLPSKQAAIDPLHQTTNQGPQGEKLVIFLPPLVYMLFFFMSIGGVQQFYGGGGGGAEMWIMGFIVCFLVLPGVALVQFISGIQKNRTEKDSGQLHILSALLVGGMWIAYLLYVAGGGFPSV